MTTFMQWPKKAALVIATVTVAVASVVAQAPPQKQTGSQPPQRPQGRPNPRGDFPAGGELNPQTVQNMVDGWALFEAQKQLDLSEEQAGTFVPRMMRLQSLRRRHTMERQRLLREMGSIAFGGAQRPDDAALSERLKAFDDLAQRSAQEVRQATQELDTILTPYQRLRFRVFEERIERQKLDMLTRARAGRAGGGGTAPAEPPVKGRGGK